MNYNELNASFSDQLSFKVDMTFKEQRMKWKFVLLQGLQIKGISYPSGDVLETWPVPPQKSPAIFNMYIIIKDLLQQHKRNLNFLYMIFNSAISNLTSLPTICFKKLIKLLYTLQCCRA